MKDNRNPLYPVFLKLHKLNLLMVGAGEVGHEKLSFILKGSPEAQITVVAPWVSDDVVALLEEYSEHRVIMHRKAFEPDDLDGFDLAIAATNIPELNQEVQRQAKARNVLVNVADTPDLCDFYLGSIVTKGPLKVGISTNGQSPTLAKRFRQWLETHLPEETEELIDNLKSLRDRMGNDFSEKVKKLNKITAGMLDNDTPA